VDIFKIVEEEARKVLEGSDIDIMLDLVKAYRSSGPKGAREKVRSLLSQWGVHVEDLAD
jgi:hypothetical protein